MNGSGDSTHGNGHSSIEMKVSSGGSSDNGSSNNGTGKPSKDNNAAPLNSSLNLENSAVSPVVEVSEHMVDPQNTPNVRVNSPRGEQTYCGCTRVILSSLFRWARRQWNRFLRLFSRREGISEPFCNDVTSNPHVSFTSRSSARGSGSGSVSNSNGGTRLNNDNPVQFSFISSSESNSLPASTRENRSEIPDVANSTEIFSNELGNKLDDVDLSEDIFSAIVDQSLDGEHALDSQQAAVPKDLDITPHAAIPVQIIDNEAPSTSSAGNLHSLSIEDSDNLSADSSDSSTIVGSIVSLCASQISSLDRCSSLKDFDKFSKRMSDIDFAALRDEAGLQQTLGTSPSGSQRNSPATITRHRIYGGSSRRRLEKVRGPQDSSESKDGLSSFSIRGALSRIVEHSSGTSNVHEVVLRQKSADSGPNSRRLPSLFVPKEAMTQDSKPYSRKSFMYNAPAKPGELLLGMCRETQFYTHSFGEGVSETESEEDDEDNVPTPTPSLHGSSCQSLATRSSRRRLGSVEATNISKGAESASSSASFDRSDNRFRDQSTSSGQSFASSTPSCSSVVPRFVGGSSLAEESRRRGGGEGGREDDRGKEDEKDIRGGGGAARGVARTHSQFSDLDREGAGSKRNSQAISSEASEVDDLSSLTNSDLESCVDASSPRSSLLQEGGGHPDQSPSYGDAPRPGSGPGVGPPSSGDASVSMQLSRPGSGDLYQDSAMPQSGTRRNRISTSSFEGRPGRPLSSSSGVGKFPDDVGRSSRPSNSSRSSHYDTAENSTNYSEQHQQYHENSDRNGSSSNSNNNYANTHRNSYTNKDQFTSSSFEGTNNPSGLPSSTTCPEFYNQASSNEESTGQFTGKIHHNRSDQDLHGQKQKSLQQQKENKNSHPSSLDSHKPQTSACGETTTVLQESHKHNRVPLRQKHPSGGSIEPEDEDSTDRRVRHRSGEGEVLSGYGSGDNLEGAEMSLGSEDQSQQDPRQTKAYRIALELLSTEETYVQVLHLIDQEFQFRVDQENRAHPMFSADHIPQMFSNVKSIYKLHHDFLLPQLQERLHQWDTCPRIGDIMTKLAPFLKMYTEYVKNFDHAMTVINSCQTKCPRFGTIMTQIHQLESCGNLTLQHHMLSPVQRIPRYELLLRDYLRKLPAHHQDRHDTTKALHLVATAASHANEAMKKIDKFQKLLEVQDNISGCVDLVSPTRELIKQGKIIKISARSGDHQERYLYLLSDLLLLCSPRLGGRVIHGPQHRLRARYNVENLHVVEGDNLETANTFYIRDSSKTVELYTQTFEEKEAWLAALFCAIEETYRRKSSLKLSGAPYGSDDDFDSSMSGGSELGNEQPLLMPVEGVAKCMKCGAQFNMVRRKHHCRACGSVVCNKCSSYKAALACEGGRSVKVCRSCHARLTQASSGSLGQPQTAGEEGLDPGGGLTGDGSACSSRMSVDGSDLVLRTRGVLEVPASAAGAIIQGHLQLKTHRKAWQSRWFALHTDFVLYSFRSNADDSALTATPLPGCTVTLLQGTRSDGSGVCDKDRERAFKLHYSKKQYVFLAASKEECARWTLQLQRASRAEIPPPDEVQ